jgi:hypothetical protein
VKPFPPALSTKQLQCMTLFAGIDAPMHVRVARRRRREPNPPSRGGEACLPQKVELPVIMVVIAHE